MLLCYGPLLALATYAIQTHRFDLDVVWLSLPLGIFTAAFLLVNEFPDHAADVTAEKRNLVVRLGKRKASRLLAATYLAGFALVAALPMLGFSRWVLLGLVPLPLAARAAWFVWSEPETFHRQRPAQPMALLVFAGYAVAVGLGTLLGSS